MSAVTDIRILYTLTYLAKYCNLSAHAYSRKKCTRLTHTVLAASVRMRLVCIIIIHNIQLDRSRSPTIHLVHISEESVWTQLRVAVGGMRMRE